MVRNLAKRPKMMRLDAARGKRLPRIPKLCGGSDMDPCCLSTSCADSFPPQYSAESISNNRNSAKLPLLGHFIVTRWQTRRLWTSFAHNEPSRPWECSDRSAPGRDLGAHIRRGFLFNQNTAQLFAHQLPPGPPKQCSTFVSMLPNFAAIDWSMHTEPIVWSVADRPIDPPAGERRVRR